jgi:hypothetical protein
LAQGVDHILPEDQTSAQVVADQWPGDDGQGIDILRPVVSLSIDPSLSVSEGGLRVCTINVAVQLPLSGEEPGAEGRVERRLLFNAH